MNLLKKIGQKAKAYWLKAVKTAKDIWPMAFVLWVIAFSIAHGLDIPATSAFDWTSLVTSTDVTNVSTEANNGWQTAFATILALAPVLLTMFFGRKLLRLIGNAISGRS